MDHVDIVLQRNFDDLVAGQIGGHGRVLPALADDVGLVGLLPVHAEAILVTVDGDRVQRQLVCGTEDANGYLSSVCDWRAVSSRAGDSWTAGGLTQDLLQLHDGAIGAQALVHRVALVNVVVLSVLDGHSGLADSLVDHEVRHVGRGGLGARLQWEGRRK